MDKCRVLLVDDHVLVREGLRELLMTFEQVEVIGEAGDGFEAIEKVRADPPDVVILDIAMPRMRGVEAVVEIKKIAPETRVLVLSMYAKEEYIRQTLQSGASGYLLKESASVELKSALSFVMQDRIYISPGISHSVVDSWLGGAGSGSDSVKKEPLTPREREVVKLLAEGYSNKEAAAALFISPKTVETHRYRIMEKLKLKSFADLVKYAIRERLVELN
jgi:DNA-binding NarL/FixJ family response regulator